MLSISWYKRYAAANFFSSSPGRSSDVFLRWNISSAKLRVVRAIRMDSRACCSAVIASFSWKSDQIYLFHNCVVLWDQAIVAGLGRFHGNVNVDLGSTNCSQQGSIHGEFGWTGRSACFPAPPTENDNVLFLLSDTHQEPKLQQGSHWKYLELKRIGFMHGEVGLIFRIKQ